MPDTEWGDESAYERLFGNSLDAAAGTACSMTGREFWNILMSGDVASGIAESVKGYRDHNIKLPTYRED